MMLLLCYQVPDKCISLQNSRVNDFVCWSHVDDDVPYNVNQERLRLFAELDSSELKQPLKMPLDVDLGQTSEHEFQPTLNLEIKEELHVDICFALLITALFKQVLN